MSQFIFEHTDFHTHILPGIDDGAKSVEVSLFLLESAKKVGISKIMATPHFYPHLTNAEPFIQERNFAYQKVLPLAKQVGIELECGAEILVYPGIEHMSSIEKLTTNGVFLLELPLSSSLITDEHLTTVKHLAKLNKVVLAHPHRYHSETVEELIDYGVLLQLNVSDICSRRGREKALKWFEKDLVYAVGTDVHGKSGIYKQYEKSIRLLKKE